jgi:hypothetical protein
MKSRRESKKHSMAAGILRGMKEKASEEKCFVLRERFSSAKRSPSPNPFPQAGLGERAFIFPSSHTCEDEEGFAFPPPIACEDREGLP